MDNALIRKRVQIRESERKGIEHIWKWIESFISPYRSFFGSSKSSEMAIDWRLRELFDSTAILANLNLASAIDGSLTSSALRWFGFTFKHPQAQRLVEVQQWVEEVNLITTSYLLGSNFNLETNELYLDLTSFGIGAISHTFDFHDDGALAQFVFKTIPIDEWYFDQDHMGNPINFYRKFFWTAEQILEKFGPDSIPDRIEEEALGEKSNKRHEIIYCVYKRRDITLSTEEAFGLLPPERRPFGEKYFLAASLEDLGDDEGGFYDFPIYIPRWRTSTGSLYGWSPAMTAIYDVLTLNQVTDLSLTAGEKAIDPPTITTRRGIMGDLDLSAAGITVVSDINALKPYESGARFDLSNVTRDDLKQSVREMFFADQLMLKESPAMTATEVNARIQLMQRLLGPTYGRFESDYLRKLLGRSFRTLYRNGKLPPIPSIILEKGWELEIDYLGPLAKSQRVNDAHAIERTMSMAFQMREAYPDILDNIDADKALRESGDVIGTPSIIWRSSDEMAKDRAQRKQEQQRQQELLNAQMEGDANKAVGEGRQALQVIQGGAG